MSKFAMMADTHWNHHLMITTGSMEAPLLSAAASYRFVKQLLKINGQNHRSSNTLSVIIRSEQVAAFAADQLLV